MTNRQEDKVDRLDLITRDLVDENITKISSLFPHCVTEGADGRVIDFDLLKQELSRHVIEGNKERYRLEWPGKKEAIVTANLPSTKTLRPVREDSVDFDNTENIYIEGDNLDVLKLLQESYLGKIKVIYIDPPYNTGKDFIYKDNFAKDTNEELFESGQKDEYNQRLIVNPETAGRYHSDWLSMMYPRLKLARNLLRDDGVVFISIAEEEVDNLKKLTNEIFGEGNFRNSFIARRHDKNLNRQFIENGLKSFNVGFEYILVYSKTSEFMFNAVYKEASDSRKSTGYWKGFWNDANRPTMRYDILGYTPESGQWKWKKETSYEAIENYQKYLKDFSSQMSLEEYWDKTGKKLKFIRRNTDGKGKNQGVENWIAPSDGILRNTNWLDILATNSDETSQGLFDFPKNTFLINELLKCSTSDNDIILDFFSGSATTAHSIFQLNAEDSCNRKFILVQIPEPTNDDSEAFIAGYKNICEIGKERIRRAAAKTKKETSADLDYGFRVYRLDESNMQDVFYKPQELKQNNLDLFADNVKPDRSSEDLLVQVMLDWGLPLSLAIEHDKIQGKYVFKVASNSLFACFDNGIDVDFAKEVAKETPLRIVFKDSSFKDDTAKSNVRQLLKQLSPNTEMKVI